jgi:HSP20 family molecular chaperone IbpA
MSAELPGLDEIDLEITVHDGPLELKASTKTSTKKKTIKVMFEGNSIAQVIIEPLNYLRTLTKIKLTRH